MSETTWQISGDYFETCNCDYLCPCLTSNMAAAPTQGDCKVALAFRIDSGRYGSVALDGLAFVLVLLAPGPMIEGDITAGLIVDDHATAEQQEAIGAIASGAAGGPMANLAPLIGTFVGVEAHPIRFEKQGMTYSVVVPDRIDQAMEGIPGAADPGQPLAIDNTLHPANARLALGKAKRTRIHAFGIDCDETAGHNNGHFAPFAWQSA